MSASASVPAQGWYVEIDNTNTGHVWTPDVVDASRRPTVNGFPRLDLTLRKRGKWRAPAFEEAPIRAYKDGRRQPVDIVEAVEESEQTVRLSARGAVELDDRVQRAVSSQEAHKVAEDIIKNETSYAANVDAPAATTQTNTLLREVNSQNEWVSFQQPPSTEPAEIDSGKLKLQQAAYHYEGEEFTLTSTNSDSDSSEGQFELLSTGARDDVTRTLEYTIPGNHAKLQMRMRFPKDPDGDGFFEGNGFELRVDGTQVGGLTSSFTTNTSGYRWINPVSGNSTLGFDISGSTTVDINGRATGSGQTDIDLVVIYDDRFSWTFDNSTDSNDALSGPELYPDEYQYETSDETTAQQITGGRLESSWNNTSNNQSVAVSNDRGQSFTTAPNSTSVETDFASPSTTLRGRLTLSRYGSQSTTPTSGHKGQQVDLYRLKADLDSTPIVKDQRYDGSAMSVLQDVAELGDFVFQFRREAGTDSIEFATAGQRTSDRNEDVIEVEGTKTVEPQVDRVVVFGPGQTERAEAVTANHGTFVDLVEDDLQPGKEVVYDPSNDTQYDLNVDYQIDYLAGEIKTVSTGAISDGQQLEITYQYQPSGSSTVSNPPANPREIVRTVAGVGSAIGAEQVALQLRRQLDSPLKEARVVIPSDNVGWDVINALSLDAVPVDGALEVREITHAPDQTVLQLGSRRSVSEVLSRIQRRLGQVGSKV
ncbi:hypothetical protein OSG_eHP31_00065 [environmental Halophage eHP-31]|nr:hypothetical protein OSG_eHP31_00065 [environmental Halophage eHP-31]